MALPLFKVTKAPRVTQTNPVESFFGAQKQRTRREGLLAQAETQFEAGQNTFEDFSGRVSQLQQKAIGAVERGDFEQRRIFGQSREYDRLDTDKASAFSRGDLSADDYKAYLDNTLGRFAVGSTQHTERLAEIETLEFEQTQNDITNVLSDFNLGRLTFEETLAQLDQFQGQFEAGTEISEQLADTLDDVRQTAVNRELSDLAGQYQRGEITSDQYMESIQGAGAILTGGDQAAPGGQDPYSDLVIEGLGTFGEVISNIQEGINVGEQQRQADLYASGQTTFEDYSKFLSGQLNLYNDGTTRSTELQDQWKGAYMNELDAYTTEVQGQYEQGLLGPNEYASFLDWAAKRREAGPKMTTDFKEFESKRKEGTAGTNSKVKVPPKLKKKPLGALKKQRREINDKIAKARKNDKPKKVAKLKKQRARVNKAILFKRK